MRSAFGKGLRTIVSATGLATSALLFTAVDSTIVQGQLAMLPIPQLLTLMPMGATAGTTVEMTITGNDLDDITAILFSNSQITATPKRNAAGEAEPNKFLVNVPANTPHGLYDVRVLTRFGISTPRVFVVGGLPEVIRTKRNNSMDTAMALEIGTVCNASVTDAAIDYYTFQARKGQRVLVDCAAREIDSRLIKVLAITDAQGSDLVVNRLGAALDWIAPADGKYFIKVHSLTFSGGAEHFYRLALTDGPRVDFIFPPVVTLGSESRVTVYGRNLSGPIDPQVAIDGVALNRTELLVKVPAKPKLAPSSGSNLLSLQSGNIQAFSWTPSEPRSLPQNITLMTSNQPVVLEVEPNNKGGNAQQITLPCDIAGQFYPAADVDLYEFTAKKGEEWWVEVNSQRLGLRTDPLVVVQKVVKDANGAETLTDVVEINDVPNPIPNVPYDAGTADPIGKFTIPADGTYRMQIRDVFGATRTDPRNVYRLQVRKAEPDFMLVAWPYFAPNTNNDSSTHAQPQTLWKAETTVLQVAAVRKDGFTGEIELDATNLPAGMTAVGSKVPANRPLGFLFLTAAEDAKGGLTEGRFIGRAEINGKLVEREITLASVIWHVRDARQDTPRPRLPAQKYVSISTMETIPVTIKPAEAKVYEAKLGESLTVPLNITWRVDQTFPMRFKAMAGFEAMKEFDVPIKSTDAKATLDLAALKTAPGEYTMTFYAVGRGKYRRAEEQVAIFEEAQKKADQEAKAASDEVTKLTSALKAATPETKVAAEKVLADAKVKQKTADAAKAATAKKLAAAKARSAPKDFADVIISEPVRIKVIDPKAPVVADKPKQD